MKESKTKQKRNINSFYLLKMEESQNLKLIHFQQNKHNKERKQRNHTFIFTTLSLSRKKDSITLHK